MTKKFFLKYFDIYIAITLLFFLYKSLVVIYLLEDKLFLIASIVVFPITAVFYPLFLVFSYKYSTLFYYQVIFCFFPIIFRILYRSKKD